ncbi:ABC transporter transmembrane domain-containing protein [Sphaerimonospora thailandensis]|uniref:Multidrug ABC transporter permease n=1 Tax=Sphaerimonospora thailandensis TaxID=795644 RepID=A0A8J3VYR2_9ACTN|nr:ABC transporter ATP-binding protein [Sphaerimonospora thailandensis]GIH69260.1 multidrug ABC transporter permease [Sphaerimonospora thailandensis]
MRSLVAGDPGIPDVRGPIGYLWWVARGQTRLILIGIGFAVVWWLGQALVPAALGLAIDALIAKDGDALIWWSGAVLGLGVVQAAAGASRHRMAVYNWLSAAYRTVQVTTRQATRLGATLPKRLSTGEVVSVGNSDIEHIGSSMDILLRGVGAVVAIAVVTVIMISTSPLLGIVVLVGVPMVTAAVGPLLRPLHRRQLRQRDLQGELATRAADIVGGLRVLRGIGGEQVFAARYREESQRVRHAGVRVASVDSMLAGAEILLPGVLIACVTWLAARFALDGRVSAGQLVAFYGYAVFLIAPIRTLTEAADKITKGHVAARRVCHILSIEPEIQDAPELRETLREDPPARHTPSDGVLVDERSGVAVRPGRLTALAAAVPEDAIAIADRLGWYAPGEVTLDGTPLADLPVAWVRGHILVADNEAKLFAGRLRDELDITGSATDEDVRQALYSACAEDIVAALPEGLDAQVAESGREFSGGQRQRLRLARALLADPEILILVEPTSAVDAHTEARIAERLGKARAERTTLVCTTSPLVLDRADLVLFVEDGEVSAEGTHRELLATSSGYRSSVTRGED